MKLHCHMPMNIRNDDSGRSGLLLRCRREETFPALLMMARIVACVLPRKNSWPSVRQTGTWNASLCHLKVLLDFLPNLEPTNGLVQAELPPVSAASRAGPRGIWPELDSGCPTVEGSERPLRLIPPRTPIQTVSAGSSPTAPVCSRNLMLYRINGKFDAEPSHRGRTL